VPVYDGKIISGSWDKTLRIWDLSDGTCLKVLQGHTDSVNCVTVVDGKIISGSYDKTLRIWDLSDGTCLKVLQGHTHSVNCVTVYDGKIISGSHDDTLRIWELSLDDSNNNHKTENLIEKQPNKGEEAFLKQSAILKRR
jgi:WD40 repeat protein